jgi:NADH-quinone oxidoreductase subunit E
MEVITDDIVEVISFISDLIESQSLDKSKIIIILQKVQEKFGYLSPTAMEAISKKLLIPEIEIMGVATFYAQFRFNEPGKHQIKVCEGTACHVKGGAAIDQILQRELNIGPGETTEDGIFSLERVACLGCCALAPVMVVDEKAFGECAPEKIIEILDSYKGGA